MNALELYALTKDVVVAEPEPQLEVIQYRTFSDTEVSRMRTCVHNWRATNSESRIEHGQWHCSNGFSWQCLATYIAHPGNTPKDYFYDGIPVTPQQLGLRS